MKNESLFKKLFALTFLTFLGCFTSCSNDDDNGNSQQDIPSTQDFIAIKEIALDNLTQTFSFDTNDGNAFFTSENGVEIGLNTSCLTLNGNPVTGTITLDYIEIFESGNMITTNKPTMGLMNDGNKSLLISGGEFYIQATQNGEDLEISQGCLQLIVPTSLTRETGEPNMSLWKGIIDANGDLTWDEIENDQGEGGVFLEQAGSTSVYYTIVSSFGWTNIDIFYHDSRPKTSLLVDVPEGYDNENSAVFLHYNGEGSALAHLDRYNAEDGLFSEHYGQVPIGLECHIIFVSESNGSWRYAIKPVTITAETIYTFDINETNIATEAQLISVINSLP